MSNLLKKNRETLKKMLGMLRPPTRSSRYPYACYPDLVLKHGLEFTETSDAFGGYITPATRSTSSIYERCFHWAKSDQNLIYVEGYALDPFFFPQPHAWVMYEMLGENDEPIYVAMEISWPKVGAAYIGVPFNTDWLVNFHSYRKEYGLVGEEFGVLAGNYQEEYSFLRTGLPNDAIYTGG